MDLSDRTDWCRAAWTRLAGTDRGWKATLLGLGIALLVALGTV